MKEEADVTWEGGGREERKGGIEGEKDIEGGDVESKRETSFECWDRRGWLHNDEGDGIIKCA